MSKNALSTGPTRKLEFDGAQGGTRGGGGGKEDVHHADVDGVGGGSTQKSEASGRPINLCLTAVCFMYQGTLARDGYPPLAKCADLDCHFDNVIPIFTVSIEEKVRLVRLPKVIKKSQVVDKPNCS